MQRYALGLSLGLALWGLTPLATADNDHNQAHAAVQAGEILPLPALLERVAREHPGNVLEVELEQRRERWVYELKLLQNDGTLVKLYVDARDGSVLKRREGRH